VYPRVSGVGREGGGGEMDENSPHFLEKMTQIEKLFKITRIFY